MTTTASREAYAPDIARNVSIRLHPTTLKMLRLVAAESDATPTALARYAVERYLAEKLIQQKSTRAGK